MKFKGGLVSPPVLLIIGFIMTVSGGGVYYAMHQQALSQTAIKSLDNFKPTPRDTQEDTLLIRKNSVEMIIDTHSKTLPQPTKTERLANISTIHLISPIGGQEFTSGQTITVNWNTNGLPSDLTKRHPRLSFGFSDFDLRGEYGSYTKSHKQSNSIILVDAITDIATILSGSTNIPIKMLSASPNSFAKEFFVITLSYDKYPLSQPKISTAPTIGQESGFIEVRDTTQSEITITLSNNATSKACFDKTQNWNLGGTWFADGEQRSGGCWVGPPGSGSFKSDCNLPNKCVNGEWK